MFCATGDFKDAAVFFFKTIFSEKKNSLDMRSFQLLRFCFCGVATLGRLPSGTEHCKKSHSS